MKNLDASLTTIDLIKIARTVCTDMTLVEAKYLVEKVMDIFVNQSGIQNNSHILNRFLRLLVRISKGELVVKYDNNIGVEIRPASPKALTADEILEASQW